MALKEIFFIKRNNTAQIKFLAVSTIFLALISFAVNSLYSEKYEKVLINAQEEKERYVVDQLTELITINSNIENKNFNAEGFKKIAVDGGIRYLLITNNNDSVLAEINFSDLSKRNSTEWTERESKYHSSDIFRINKTITTVNSQELNLICEFSISQMNSKIQNSKIEIGIISFLIFAVSFLVLFFASSIIILPLHKISNSAAEISSGNLSKRIDNKSENEFGKIASSVNVLADNLQKAYTQIEKLNKELKFQFRDKIGELNYEINQRRQAEYSLKQSEEQFRLLFEMAPIGMVISSIHGRILKVNAAFHSALGYSEKEILEKKIKDLTFDEDQILDIGVHEKLIEGVQQSAYYEKRMLRKDGQIIYVIVEAVIVKNKTGKPSHFIEQVIDITERKRVEKELILAKEKAEESDRLKSAFLAQMSHEIRTPLNVILTAMNLIHDDLDDTDEDTKMILDSVSSAGKRLQRTIDLILSISAVQSGSYSPEIKDFDLDKQLIVLVEEFKTFENEKDIKISYINKSKYSVISADYYSVMQIFQNLIGNAIKYTLKGTVKVILEDFNKEKLQVVVQDTGIGISKEYISKLFAPFSQEDVGYKREFEGNGLGLALVKKYVEINNADILVESEKDRGSTFTVIFNKRSMNSSEMKETAPIKSNNIRELA
jgi:PAS domain S-box-containing protein